MINFVPVNSTVIENNLIYLRDLVFEVTDKCNLKCKYCGLSDMYLGYDERSGKMLPFNKAKLIIDYLVNLWKKNNVSDTVFPISIGFYGGEPLINFALIEQIIEYIEGLHYTGRQFIYTMTTNAMLLNKYMNYLVEKKFRLMISLDGDKTAQSYRIDHNGNNSFDRVYKNVKLLQEKHPKYYKYLVNFNSVLHNRNDVAGTYNFIKKRNIYQTIIKHK